MDKDKKKFLLFDVWPLSDITVITLLSAIGIIFVSLSLRYHVLEPETGSFIRSRFIYEIGTALIVAVILILTAETFSRRRQAEQQEGYLRKINEDVYKAVFGQSLPPSILTEVIDSIVKNSFIRKDFKVRYFLKASQNEKYKGFLEGKVEVEYILENLTDDPQEYTIRSKVSKKLLPDNGANLKFGYLQIVQQEHPENPEKIKQIEEEISTSFLKTIGLKPSEKNLKIKYDFELFFPLEYSDVWVNNYPTENLILTISDKDGILKKGAMALHPTSERLEINVDNPTTTEWQIKGGLLPCQGINFWWYPTIKNKV